MSCVTNGETNFSEKINNAIENVSEFDKRKQIFLASVVNTESFKEFVSDNVTTEDFVKGKKIDDIKNLSVEDISKLNQNKFKSLLNRYYLHNYFDVDATATATGLGDNLGFSSTNALKVALNHTVNLILTEAWNEIEQHGNIQKNTVDSIIARVIDKIVNNYHDFYMTVFANDIISNEEKYGKQAVEDAKQYLSFQNSVLESSAKINKLREEYNNKHADLKESAEKVNNYKRENGISAINEKIEKKQSLTKEEAKKFKEFKDLMEKHKNISNKLRKIEDDIRTYKNRLKNDLTYRTVTAFNLVYDHSKNYTGKKVQLRNYSSLVANLQSNGNEWIDRVFHNKRLTSLARKFENVSDINDFIEDGNDSVESIQSRYVSKEDIDETTKSWEDSLYRNVSQSVGERVRLYLSQIPVLDTPVNSNRQNDAINTNNELGVMTFYDADYLISQIHSFKNINSVQAFMDSLWEKGNKYKKLYGLTVIARRMQNDRDFANLMFVNFAKPLIYRTQLTVNGISENGVRFAYDNLGAFPEQELYWRFYNKLLATYNSPHYKDISNQLASKSMKEVNEENKMKLFDMLTSYFPNISKDWYDAYLVCRGNTNDSIKSQYNNLRNCLKNIADGVNIARQNYTNAKAQLKKGEQLDWDRIFPKILKREISTLSEYFAESGESQARLTSRNAEGNMTANIGKNCYISRFFEMILSEDEEESNRGLYLLADYITQGITDEKGNIIGENQYTNNPLFFGTQDTSGFNFSDLRRKTGMFSIDKNGQIKIEINAKDVLKYSLFDGTRNSQNSDGKVYEHMTSSDYFLSQFFSFIEPAYTKREELGMKDGFIMGKFYADYAMRTPSDAPKVYFIRAPKYITENDQGHAIYGHVLDEIILFEKGLNSLFKWDRTVDRFVLRSDIDGLYDRVHFDSHEENIVDKLIDRKTGRLRGKVFQFNRLFSINNHNYGNELEKILNIVDENGSHNFIIYDETLGKYVLNTEHEMLNVIGDDENKKISFYVNLKKNIAKKQAIMKLIQGDNNEVEDWKKLGWRKSYLQYSRAYYSDYYKTLQRLRPFREKGRDKKYEQQILDANWDDFLINSYIMNMNYDDLFEGDYKFYNNARDFLKRMKESQAGGESYAAYDIKKGFNNNINDLKEAVIKFDNGSEFDIKPRTGFHGVTYYCSTPSYDRSNIIYEDLYNNYIKQGMSEETAKRLASTIQAGYLKPTKANDGQSLITLDEFIRRRWADGTLNQYMNLLCQLLDPNITAERINLEDVNKLIQVQKNFYYDKIYDPNVGMYVPRQIKNSEFVLIPKLLPEGSDLRILYDWMKENDIDQLNTDETSKAGNRDILTIFDKEGHLVKENIYNEDKKGNRSYIALNTKFVQDYSYMFLYKQQEVPEHMKDKTNKAGAQFMKKSIDNTKIASKETRVAADNVQSAYTENIKSDFLSFLDSMGWEMVVENVNGEKTVKIYNKKYTVIKGDEEATRRNREELNFDKFYKTARIEAARLGMDSNFMEYLMPDKDTGVPPMPNYTNKVARKLEAVAQSLYNKTITRQTLPGYHATQISCVGYSANLKFDEKEGIMEVLIPRWSKLIPKGKNKEENDAILKQIQEEGLDIHIGYRMPTEGKQSISKLRIVGFLNDALGSTIVVPNEWVIQTGSDFDVDSIYAISWEMYSNTKNGITELHKVRYKSREQYDKDFNDYKNKYGAREKELEEKENKSQEEELELADIKKQKPNLNEVVDDNLLYLKYISKKIDDFIEHDERGNIVETDDNKKIVNIKKQYWNKGVANKVFDNKNRERNTLFAKLPGWAKGIIDRYTRKSQNDVDSGFINEDYESAQTAAITQLQNQLDKGRAKEGEFEKVKQYISLVEDLLTIHRAQTGGDTSLATNVLSEKFYEDAIHNAESVIDNINKIVGNGSNSRILTRKEFGELKHEQKLDKKARNNFIIDNLMRVLGDPAFREEQYSRSNFDDITAAKNEAFELLNINEETQSPHDIFTQISYFDDVMSGRRLKALSVNWDTFCSRNNRIRAHLTKNNEITVILENEEIEQTIVNQETGKLETVKMLRYDVDLLKKSYPDMVVNGNKIRINLRDIGYSETDRNVIGRLITPYTAQTTAHHLDAVKEGSIPNINEYTFPIYKIITSLGLTHRMSVFFMLQPAIERIVAKRNDLDSIFRKSTNDPIKLAINEIIDELGAKRTQNIGSYQTMEKLMLELSNNDEFVKTFKEIWGEDICKFDEDGNITSIFKGFLDESLLEERLKSRGNEEGYSLRKNDENNYEKAAIDIGFILTFANMKRITNRVDSYIQCLNIEKLGNTPSIFESHRLAKNIDNLIKEKHPTMAVYENEDSETEIPILASVFTDGESKYPSVNAIYENVLKTSIATNSKLFVTESDTLYDIVCKIEDILNTMFNEERYVEFRKYVVTTLYNDIDLLLTPLVIDSKTGEISLDLSEENVEEGENYWDAERSRIYGYGVLNDGFFEVGDIQNPTEEELSKFRKLTPAQKVLFIQKSFPHNSGIFGALDVTLFSEGLTRITGTNRQYINYTDTNDNIENLLYDFKNAYSNHNPFVKMAAVDLVKYAFIAEGFNFRTGNISRIVPNDVIIDMGLVEAMNALVNSMDERYANFELVTKFARSHSEYIQAYNLSDSEESCLAKLEKKRTDGSSTGFVHLSANLIERNKDGELGKLVEHLHLNYNVNKFIRIYRERNGKKEPVLYQVYVPFQTGSVVEGENADITNLHYFLIPLNKLNQYETYDYSYNGDFNVFSDYKDYILIANDIANKAANPTIGRKDEDSKESKELQEKLDNLRKIGSYNSNALNPKINHNLFDQLRNHPSFRGALDSIYYGLDKLLSNIDETTTSILENNTYIVNDSKGIYIYAPSAELSKLLHRGENANQLMTASNGLKYNVRIQHLGNKFNFENLKKGIDGKIMISEEFNNNTILENADKKNPYKYESLQTALAENHQLLRNTNLYRISFEVEKTIERNAKTGLSDAELDPTDVHVTREEITSKTDDVALEDRARIDSITDDELSKNYGIDLSNYNDPKDIISQLMIRQISYKAKRDKDKIAARFEKEMMLNKINRNNRGNLKENRSSIYNYAAKYYEQAARNLLYALEHFDIGSENGLFRIDDEKLYEELRYKDEYFNDLAYTLLDALTFGDYISDIMTIDYSTEDEQLNKDVARIRKAIISIKHNDIVKNGMRLMMDVYMKKYATNPMIREDLLKIRDQFGDIDSCVAWIVSPCDYNNQEIQTVLKQVYTMFAKTELFTANQNVDEFKKKIKELGAENVDLSRIIDNTTGRLKRKYTDEYVEALQKINQEYEASRIRFFNNPDDKEIAKDYIRKQYDRDMFYYKYCEQRLTRDYYLDQINNYYKNAFINGDLDVINPFFLEYTQLKRQLLDLQSIASPSNSQLQQMNNIKSRINNLRNIDLYQGDEVKEKQCSQINAYIRKLKDINEKYFKREEYEGFIESRDKNLNILKKYDDDIKYDNLSISEKREQFEEYDEAYDWLKRNGQFVYNPEFRKKLSDAYKALTKNNKDKISTFIRAIGVKNNAYDEFGVLDGRKFSNKNLEEIQNRIRNIFQSLYENDKSEVLLIKGTNLNEGDVLDLAKIKIEDLTVRDEHGIIDKNKTNENKAIFAALKRALKSDESKLEIDGITKTKYQIIGDINTMLKRISRFDSTSGTRIIDYTLFTNWSFDDLNKLADLYRQYRQLDAYTQKPFNYKGKIVRLFDIKIDQRAHDNAMHTVQLEGGKGGNYIDKMNIILNSILSYKDINGDSHINYALFGYKSVPELFRDEEKMKARKFLANNITRVTTEYYNKAKNEALSGTHEQYLDWFYKNHYYDTFSHRYVPLPIWTTNESILHNEEGEKTEAYSATEYLPSYENSSREIKDEYKNSNFNEYDFYHYRRPVEDEKERKRLFDGLSNLNIYDSDLNLSKQEEDLYNYLTETLFKYATTNQGKNFLGKGFLPRERSAEKDLRWGLKQAAALFGYSYHSGTESDSFVYNVDYVNDREADMDMLNFIKTKDTQTYLSNPVRGDMSADEYIKKLAEVREQNKQIREHNLEIDRANRNNNWMDILEDYIYNATIFNNRQAAKPLLYLLLEDLRNNKAYAVKGMLNKDLIQSKRTSTEDDENYVKVNQDNAVKGIHNLTRRLLRSEYHENSKLRTMANFIQNMASAKFMVFNLYGGINNVTIGKTNIMMEEWANEYFGFKEFTAAQGEYFSHITSYLACAFNDKALNETSAILKQFNIIDFDEILMFGAGSDSLEGWLRKARDFTYSFQSMGEHYMQNCGLLAMMRSNRLFTDNDGTIRIGDLKDYSWNLEKIAMMNVIGNDEKLSKSYKALITDIQKNPRKKMLVATSRMSINQMFLRMIRDNKNEDQQYDCKELADRYNKERAKLLKNAESEFKKFTTVRDMWEFENGKVRIKEDIQKQFKEMESRLPKGKNPLGDLETLIGGFKRKVELVNQKIHGVYDKNGAAMLEKKWYGSLMMQYRKHMPWGAYKRWRRKGYWSEFRNSNERGAYQSVIDFLCTEFLDFKDRRDNKEKQDNTNTALASLQTVIESIINTVTYLKFNYQSLATWQQRNLKRNLGDLVGVVAAMSVAGLIYALGDDDDIKDDFFLASLLYVCDRQYSEATMYLPSGISSEVLQLQSSPLAGVTIPIDALKIAGILPSYIFDEDSRKYKQGPYRGHDKLGVLIQKEIPVLRQYQRLKFIKKANKYYKVGESQLGLNWAINWGKAWHNR